MRVSRPSGAAAPGSFLFQNPEHQFLAMTVAGELADSLAGAETERLEEALDRLGAHEPSLHGGRGSFPEST